MATSGSFTTDAVTFQSGNMAIQFSWSAGTPDIVNNTTPVTWSIKGCGTYPYRVNTGPIRVYINGTLAYEAYTDNSNRLSMANDMVITNGSFTAQHNSSGNYSFTAEVRSSIYYFDVPENPHQNGSGSWSLEPIPRSSTLTVQNGTIGTQQSLTINKASASFTHSISYSCGAASGSIASLTQDSVVNWTPPYSLLDQATRGRTVNATITISTYYGNTLLGSNSYSVSYFVPIDSETKPTASMTVTPYHSLPAAFSSVFVQGKSKARASFSNAEAKHGASVLLYAAMVEGSLYEGNPSLSDFLSTSGTVSVAGTITDTRGISSDDITQNITVYPYSNPAIIPCSGSSAVECYRCDSTGAASNTGTYTHIRAGRSYSSVNGINTCFLRYKYRLTNGGGWSGWIIIINESSSSDYYDEIVDISTSVMNSYDVLIQARDAVGNIAEMTFYIPAQDITLHLGAGGKSIGIGRAANTAYSNRVDIGWNTYFDNDVYIGGSKISDFVVEQGTSGIWTYRKWNSGIAECWCNWTGQLTHYSVINNWYSYVTTVHFISGLFVEDSVPTVVYTGGAGQIYSISGMIIQVSHQYVSCYALASSGGEQEIRFHISAKGVWK